MDKLKCPGAINISGTPTLAVKTCPECGAEVELFSSDSQIACRCGFVVYNDIQSCIRWCQYARECVGDEMYEALVLNPKSLSQDQILEQCAPHQTEERQA